MCGFGKDFRICLKRNLCAAFGGRLHLFQITNGFTMFKALIITVLTVTDFNFQPFRQSIYNRSTNTVQTAGDLVSAAAEFTACMQNGKDNCYSRNAQLWLNANWNASSIILNTDNISRQKVDQNLGTVSCKNLIDRVVHDLIDQMMKTLWAGGTDIHTRTLAYCVQTFQNLNITCVVIFNHLRIFFWCIFQSDSLHRLFAERRAFPAT